MFSHTLYRVRRFSNKIHNLILFKSFPMPSAAVADLESLKLDIANFVIISISNNDPIVVESDASDYALATTLGQNGCLIAFFSKRLTNCEKITPPLKKKLMQLLRH